MKGKFSRETPRFHTTSSATYSQLNHRDADFALAPTTHSLWLGASKTPSFSSEAVKVEAIKAITAPERLNQRFKVKAMAPKIDIPADSQFSLANFPFGVITTPVSSSPHVAVAVGNYALDLSVFASSSGFSECPAITSHLDVFSQPALNDFAALGRSVHREVRQYLQKAFVEESVEGSTEPFDRGLFLLKDIKTHLPFRIGDYTDFFVGKYHAQNAGAMIRGISNALHPNYMHLPVGYHGRASSVVVSGTSIRRPHGQVMENAAAKTPKPIFTSSKRLDFELELGAFVCKANKMGEPVSIKEAEENIFGLVLMNDWSARDIRTYFWSPIFSFGPHHES